MTVIRKPVRSPSLWRFPQKDTGNKGLGNSFPFSLSSFDPLASIRLCSPSPLFTKKKKDEEKCEKLTLAHGGMDHGVTAPGLESVSPQVCLGAQGP